MGPAQLAAEPVYTEVLARRYLCLACGCVCQVVPAGVVPGRRYYGPAVALALTLWSVRGESEMQVRQRISPDPLVGPSVVGWASLRRWGRAYGSGAGTLRERAARYVQQLAARSPLSAQRYGIEPRIFAASLQPG